MDHPAITAQQTHRLDCYLAKMLFQTTIYHLWREKNARRHHQVWITTEQMKKRIDRAIRNRHLSLWYKFDHKLGGLMQRWMHHTI
ncbi:hypothetical protein N665_0156s0010 [Sinapis alba]|nr:hypothetical protein N665_0156s0010 [Sinapis alba]